MARPVGSVMMLATALVGAVASACSHNAPPTTTAASVPTVAPKAAPPEPRPDFVPADGACLQSDATPALPPTTDEDAASEEVEQILAAARSQIVACFPHPGGDEPGIVEGATLGLDVVADGRVTRVLARAPIPLHPDIVACLHRVSCGWRLPHFYDGNKTHVTLDLRMLSRLPRAGDAGGLPEPQALSRIVLSQVQLFQDCYDHRLHERPKLAGAILVMWALGADGSSPYGYVEEDTLDDAEVADCMLRVFVGATFPRATGKPVLVGQRFNFSPRATAPRRPRAGDLP